MITWTLSKSQKDTDFPYRVEIHNGEKLFLDLRTTECWPPQASTLPCIRTKKTDAPFTKIEQIPVVSVQHTKKEDGGKITMVILDRPTESICQFLSVMKDQKEKEEQREQIYWSTPEALTANRPNVKIPTHRKEPQMTIAIDTKEKHAWKFPACNTQQADLPAGDYALVDKNGIVAVIERKTFNEMVHHLSDIASLHQQLQKLESTTPRPTVIIEANYADFLNPKKQATHTPAYCAKAIGDIQPMHPKVPILYMSTRKVAMEWAFNHFHSIMSQTDPHRTPDLFMAAPPQKEQAAPHKNDSAPEAQVSILDKLPHEFDIDLANKTFPNIPAHIIRQALARLKKEGKVTSNRGKNARWTKTANPHTT